MGSKKFEKGSDEFKFFAEFWNFVQKYYIPENNDEYWAMVVKDAADLMKKYPGELFSNLTNAYLNYLEDKDKKGNY